MVFKKPNPMPMQRRPRGTLALRARHACDICPGSKSARSTPLCLALSRNKGKGRERRKREDKGVRKIMEKKGIRKNKGTRRFLNTNSAQSYIKDACDTNLMQHTALD